MNWLEKLFETTLCKKLLKCVTQGWFGIFSFQGMAEVGRDLWGPLVQPLLQQSHPEHPGCPGPVTERFWIYQGMDPPQPLRTTCSILSHTHSSVTDRTSCISLPASWTPLQRAQDTFSTSLSGICTHPWGSPEAPLGAEQSQGSQPHHDGIFSSIFPVFWFSRHLQT